MYHIKQDKRSHASAKLIVDGLLHCLKEKKFNEITITDIHKASTVGRSTFYRLFDCTEDIIQYKCDQELQEVFENYIKFEPENLANIIYYLIQYWVRNSTILEILVQINRIDILCTSHYKFLNQIKEVYIGEPCLSSDKIDYRISILTYTIIGVLRTWILRGKKESKEDLYLIFKENITSTPELVFDA